MTEDNLTKEKLLGMTGDRRFESEEDFKDFMMPEVKDALVIGEERMGEEPASTAADDNRYDIYIYDAQTRREKLIVIGLKTVKSTPKLTEHDINNFHRYCRDEKVLYGALLTETECHLYQYKKTEVTTDTIEVEEIPPLNHIDYEFGKIITPEKVKDLALSRKWVLAALIGAIVFLIFINIAHAVFCAKGGPVKANVTADGKKIYYLPDSKGYDNVIIGDQPGERHFCQEADAIKKGWVKNE
ncbi:hypothetical protein JW752_04255 [Candidatus Peregrinibacteria bacterium]|nr:hypothetical protein [Candidatus Peregrinibacteria bacterium]